MKEGFSNQVSLLSGNTSLKVIRCIIRANECLWRMRTTGLCRSRSNMFWAVLGLTKMNREPKGLGLGQVL